MLYNIDINQFAAVKLGLHKKLKPQDFIIFSFIRKFAKAQKCIKFSESGTIFYMFHWSLIKQQLPLLNLNTRQSIKKRIDKLVEANLIAPHKHNQAKGKQYYKFTELADSLEFYNISQTETTNVYTRDNERLHERDNERLHNNHYNKDNNINNNSLLKENEKIEVREEITAPKSFEQIKLQPNYPVSFTDKLKQAVEQYFEMRKTIGAPFTNVASMQAWVSSIQLKVKEHGEDDTILAIMEATSNQWRSVYVKKQKTKHKKKKAVQEGYSERTTEMLKEAGMRGLVNAGELEGMDDLEIYNFLEKKMRESL